VFWAATLAPATIVALVGEPLAAPTRRLLDASLAPEHNAPPHVGHVLVLATHNIPLGCWPLLLGVWGAHAKPSTRRWADRLVVAWLIVNTLFVGLTLGAYGTAAVPYFPELPLEWGGLALGASGWLVQRRRPLTVREGIGLFALVAGVLACAAVVETVAVPHR
jgi:hypothetical protein